MSKLIPEEILEQIRQSLDIVDVVGSYIQLKKAGNAYKAVCPFHNDSRPSLTVNTKMQIYKCFACGAGGNIFKFVMEYDKLSFPEAVELLGERCGISIKRTEADKEQQTNRNEMYRVMEWVCKVFEKNLRQDVGKSAYEYLQQRKFKSEYIDAFRVGYATAERTDLYNRAKKKGLSAGLLEACGLIVSDDRGDYRDKFLNRVMFPICDVQGRVIAFGGRTMDDQNTKIPKYLNSPETALFKKRNGVYAIHQARDQALSSEKILLMEGYTDVIMAHQHGVTNTVACLGTALGAQQITLLKRYAKTAILFFDADEAGQRAAQRSLEIFYQEGMDVKIAKIPEGKDPCDYLVANGAKAIEEQVGEAQDFVDYTVEVAREQGLLKSIEGRERTVLRLLEVLQYMTNPMQLDMYLSKVGSHLGVKEALLRRDLQSIRSRRKQREFAEPESSPRQGVAHRLSDKINSLEMRLCALAVVRPALLKVVLGLRKLDEYRNHLCRAILQKSLSLQDAGYEATVDALINGFHDDDEVMQLLMNLHERGCAFEGDQFNKELESLVDAITDYKSEYVVAGEHKRIILTATDDDEESVNKSLEAFQRAIASQTKHKKRK